MAEQAEYDGLRLKLRRLVKDHNIMSAGVAKDAGVRNFEAYNGAGLSGLYGGLNKAELLKRKGLPADADRLEHANHEELAANYFKATQAIAKLKRDKKGKLPQIKLITRWGKLFARRLPVLAAQCQRTSPLSSISGRPKSA